MRGRHGGLALRIFSDAFMICCVVRNGIYNLRNRHVSLSSERHHQRGGGHCCDGRHHQRHYKKRSTLHFCTCTSAASSSRACAPIYRARCRRRPTSARLAAAAACSSPKCACSRRSTRGCSRFLCAAVAARRRARDRTGPLTVHPPQNGSIWAMRAPAPAIHHRCSRWRRMRRHHRRCIRMSW